MTEFIEGIIREVATWKEGVGGYVKLDQDPMVYYYEGKVEFPNGAVKLEVVNGTGIHAKEKKIVGIHRIIENQALPPTQIAPNSQGIKMIQLPFNEFQAILQQKSLIPDSRKLALSLAATIYAGMNKKEEDPKAAARDVADIAREIEASLV